MPAATPSPPRPAHPLALQCIALAPGGQDRVGRRGEPLVERARAARRARPRARSSVPARRSDVAISASSGGNSSRRHVQADAEHRPALLGAPLDQDAGHLAAVDPDVVRPLDRAPPRGSASHTATAAASGRALVAARAAPPTSAPPIRGGAVHARPWRPRPAVCSSAVTSVPCGAPASASSLARSFVESVTRWWTRGRADHRGRSRTSASGCSAERAGGVAAVDRQRERAVGVLVDDQLARAHVGERLRVGGQRSARRRPRPPRVRRA